jgi:hypothetical protein
MSSWILFFAVALAALSAIFYSASGMAFHGSNWATDLCWNARFFCHTPEVLAVAAAVFGALWIAVRLAA